MRLTAHFTLAELTASQTAVRKGIDNTPPAPVLAALRRAAEGMEAVRSALGDRPISISSGYRSAALNKAVGGSATSAHVAGYAIDFNCYGFGPPLQVCEAIASAGIPFDQLIHEFGRWVHIGFSPALRRQLLTIDNVGTRTGLHPIR